MVALAEMGESSKALSWLLGRGIGEVQFHESRANSWNQTQ